MRYLLLISLLFTFCVTNPEPTPEIEWKDVAGKKYGITEELNIYQSVRQSFRFGYGDTIYIVKKYWNPKDSIFNCVERPNWIRYFKGPVYNKHYENDPLCLTYTWSRKEYADSLYQTPVMGNAITDDWFLWKIDTLGLYMGTVDLNRDGHYWVFSQE